MMNLTGLVNDEATKRNILMANDSKRLASASKSSWAQCAGERVLASIVMNPLWTVIFVALVLRLASALYQGDSVTVMPGVFDQVSYDALARRVVGGHGFTFATNWWPATKAGEPTAHWSFLYTLYLATIYAIVGAHPIVARLIQAVAAGVLQPLLTWRIGRRLFGNRVGVIGAALSAIYIYFFFYAGALMTETFYIVAILWALGIVIELANQDTTTSRDPGGRLRWVWLGLALSIATLLRQEILLTVPFIFGWLLFARRRLSTEACSGNERLSNASVWTTFKGLVVAFAVIAAMVCPWTIRNYLVFHEFVPLNTNSGYVFFWANHPIHGTNFMTPVPDDVYGRLIPRELRGLNEAALDRALLERSIGFVVADPARYALLSMSRVIAYFEFWPSPDSPLLSNLSRTFSFGLLLPFTIFGMVLSIRDARTWLSDRQRVLVLTYLFITVYTLIHVLSWALIRYRLPVDAILILFGARGLDGILLKASNLFGFSAIRWPLGAGGVLAQSDVIRQMPLLTNRSGDRAR